MREEGAGQDQKEQRIQDRYGRYPIWIEQIVAQIMAKLGYKGMMATAKEVDVMDQQHLLNIIRRVKEVHRSEGHDR